VKLSQNTDTGEILKNRVKENPEDLDSWIDLGSFFLRRKNFVEAEKAARKALELAPKNSFSWFQLALALSGKKDLVEAEQAYREAIKIRPDFINAWFNLGLLLGQRNDLQGAKEVFEELLKINPQDSVALNYLRRVYYELGAKEEAINAYRTSFNIDPSQSRTAYNLALLLSENKKTAEAEYVLRKALDFNPFSTILLQLLYQLLGINLYIPKIVSATSKKTLKFGSYEAIVVGDIITSGRIQYEFVLFLYEQGKQEPILFVSAEKNSLATETDTAGYFLCVFDEHGHVNFGLYASLNDLEYFTKKALEIIASKYKFSSEDMPKLA